MSTYISNFETLATTPLRNDALQIVEAAYESIDTKAVIRSNCTLTGSVLRIKDTAYDLSLFEHVYLIGFGKASCTAVSAIEDVLTTKVSAGVVIDKSPGVCHTVKVFQGAHPLPSHLNVGASQEIADLAISATEKDLVIVVVSGGGSSLLCLPMSECDQGSKLYDAFLTTGGSISELNTLRKHISSVKGGGLAKMLYPATVVALIFSDVPGDAYELVASGPTYKDTSTIEDAKAILLKYGITEEFEFTETPKEDIYFEKITNIPLVSNLHAVEGMKKKAIELGYDVVVQSTEEYREASRVLSDMQKALKPKTVVLVAGEPSVIVTHKGDKGGRNEYAAGMALLSIQDNQVCVPFATDGIDNKSVAAGAIIDTEVVHRSRAKNISIQEYVDSGKHDDLCSLLGVQIITGATGSNVSDCVVYMEGESVTSPALVRIASVSAESIVDSRGIETLSVSVYGTNGYVGTFSVPSGASTGAHEAAELRDDGTSKGGVTKAIAYINGELSSALSGMAITDQKGVDDRMVLLDGTSNKKRLGGNTLIGVSIALAKLAAKSEGKETWQYLNEKYFKERAPAFPRLYANLINGGKHAATKLAFQEYHVVPKTTVVSDALALILTIQSKLREVADFRYKNVVTGDEGGYALPIFDVEEPLQLLEEVTVALGVRDQVDFALDVAATSFYDEKKKRYIIDNEEMDEDQMLHMHLVLSQRYNLLSIEDPFYEEDFSSFTKLQNESGHMVVVGDDLTTTNRKRLESAVSEKSIGALIIKPNQIGTLTETVQAMQYAYMNNIACIVSHRSGETCDDFIADLAYASGAFGIKAGARGPKEREVKYERLSVIEQMTTHQSFPSVAIVTTLGPATNTVERISDIVQAGADMVRLNFSWGTHENMLELMTLVRQVAKSTGKRIPILQDLSGPRLVMKKGHMINKDLSEVITEKDKNDLAFGIAQGVDFVALSYVSSARDIYMLRKNIAALNGSAKIIAKIERREAIDNIEEICDASDGIMIARGDLGIALPFEQVPFIQRDILELCNKKGKFVIVATEMMLSMVENDTPSRAEVNDVATAVTLGASAVMLSEESARGKHPVETVRAMKRIVAYAEKEKHLPFHPYLR